MKLDERRPQLLEVTEKGMDKPETVKLYDNIFSKAHFYYHRVAKRALGIKKDPKVIADVGTGPGFLAIELAKMSNAKVIATDISPNMIKTAEENAKKSGANIEFKISDANKLPFDDDSIDLLTASFLIHFLKDMTPLLNELKRVMKPGGRVMLTTFRRDVFFLTKEAVYLIDIFIRNKPIHKMGAVIESSFTRQEIKTILDQEGLNSYHIFSGLARMDIIIGF